jgi:uncharacterized LabA/DUF88 family protein
MLKSTANIPMIETIEDLFHIRFKYSNLSINSYQRRRLKCEKLTEDGHQVMAKAHIAFGMVK